MWIPAKRDQLCPHLSRWNEYSGPQYVANTRTYTHTHIYRCSKLGLGPIIKRKMLIGNQFWIKKASKDFERSLIHGRVPMTLRRRRCCGIFFISSEMTETRDTQQRRFGRDVAAGRSVSMVTDFGWVKEGKHLTAKLMPRPVMEERNMVRQINRCSGRVTLNECWE